MSELTKNQVTVKSKQISKSEKLVVQIRHDDNCGNGHNSFAITAGLFENRRWVSGGCQHELVAEHFPELAPFLKWHLCSTDSPMHYVANTVYLAKTIPAKQDKWYFYLEGKCISIVDLAERDEMITKYGKNAIFEDYPNPLAKESDLEAARNSAIWPDATLEQLSDKDQLMARLPALMAEFKSDVESLGLTF